MKRKSMERKIAKGAGVLAFSLLAMAAVTGCGPQQKTESEIQNDVEQYLKSELAGQGVKENSSLENFEITDRDTDKGAKIDDIQISCDIVSDTSRIEIDSLMAEYSLSGNHWVWSGGYLLSEAERTAIPTVTEDEAAAWFADGGYDQVNFNDRQTDEKAGTDTFSFQMTRAGEYKTEYFQGTVTYRLGGDGQWEANDSDAENHAGKGRMGRTG